MLRSALHSSPTSTSSNRRTQNKLEIKVALGRESNEYIDTQIIDRLHRHHVSFFLEQFQFKYKDLNIATQHEEHSAVSQKQQLRKMTTVFKWKDLNAVFSDKTPPPPKISPIQYSDN